MRYPNTRKRLSGFHNLPSAKDLVSRSRQASRSQLASLLARLEHEQVQLNSQMDAWEAKKKEAGIRLAKVRRDIDALRQRLYGDEPWEAETEHATRGHVVEKGRTSQGADAFTLEY